MERSKQTEQVKVRLFKLVDSFTKKYVHRYYKQFTGEIEDLVMDYYIEFLTPKSREKGKEASLLDKYDDSITSLEYLVKVSVQRKLIDSSRQDPIPMLRIDNFTDEFGDCITAAFDLVSDPDRGLDNMEDMRVFTKEEIYLIKKKFESLPEKMKTEFKKQFEEVRNVINPSYQNLFDIVVDFKEKVVEKKRTSMEIEVLSDCSILSVRVQQVTPKTVCALVGERVVDFNRETGEARGKEFKYLSLTEQAVEWIKENVQTFHSGFSRQEFVTSK